VRTITEVARLAASNGRCMTDAHLDEPLDGPILLWTRSEPAAAARLAEAAGALLLDRPVVVLATWAPPPIMGPYDGVMDALYDIHADLRAEAHDAAVATADSAAATLRRFGLQVATRISGDPRAPWSVVLEVADELDASVIVAPATEATLPHAGSLGRQARGLAHRTRRPLLLLTPDSPAAAVGAPAIFAYDGSEPAGHAVRLGARLLRPRPAFVASAWQATSYAVGLALLAVPAAVAETGIERLDATARTHAGQHADDAAAQLDAAGWAAEPAVLEARHDASDVIVGAAAEHDAAVIVTGTRGRARVTATLLGSTAEEILRHAGRPVLLIPPTPEA